jgi:hypothetical protein
MLGKIKKIWADLSENMKSRLYFITILHQNLGKFSIAPPPQETSALTQYAYART